MKLVVAGTCEANIYDQRPDPIYGTGAIVNFAEVDPMPKAAGNWNTFLITAKGDNLIVVFFRVAQRKGHTNAQSDRCSRRPRRRVCRCAGDCAMAADP
jgi:hypothetical protein